MRLEIISEGKELNYMNEYIFGPIIDIVVASIMIGLILCVIIDNIVRWLKNKKKDKR